MTTPTSLDAIYRYIIVNDLDGEPPTDITLGNALLALGAAIANGTKGPQGFQGFQGFQGAQGHQGFQGNQGNQGAQGFQGVQGAQGTQGAVGSQGAQGSQGTQGFQGTVGATALLAVTAYDNGGSAHTYSTTSSASADVDAANLQVVFTAPASGAVMVRLTATIGNSSDVDYQYWSVRESGSDLTTKQAILSAAAAQAGPLAISAVFHLTGLSGGAHTYTWGFACGSGTGDLYVGALSDGDTVATMEVWAA